MSFHLALPLSTNASMTEFICPSTVKNSPVSKSLGTLSPAHPTQKYSKPQSPPNSEWPPWPPLPSQLCSRCSQSCRARFFLFIYLSIYVSIYLFIYFHPPPLEPGFRAGERTGEPSIIWRLNSHQDPARPPSRRLTADSPHLF